MNITNAARRKMERSLAVRRVIVDGVFMIVILGTAAFMFGAL